MKTTRCSARPPRAEPSIAVYIKGQSLEEALDVAESITPSFQYLEFVVETFDKATRVVRDEIVGDGVAPGLKEFEEWVETRHPASLDTPAPPADAAHAISL